MDLEGAAKNLSRFKKIIKKTVYPISVLKKEGLEELLMQSRKKYKRVVIKIGSVFLRLINVC